MRHYGIVLHRFFPKKYTIALLDSQLGRIDAVVRYDTAMLGALISYEIEYKRTTYFIQAVRIEDAPLALAQSDILFLHHVLELCYHFMPVGSCVADMFELVQFIYKPVQHNMFIKKIFLFKLLYTLGMSAPEEHEHGFFEYLATVSIDTLDAEQLDLTYEKKLDRWLLYCVAEYTDIQALKTIHFLVKSRVA